MALIFDAEPLLYAAAWRFFPGSWIAVVPQDFDLAVILLGAGCLLGFAVVLATIRQFGFGMNEVTVGQLQIYYIAVLVSGFGIGCAAAWLTYMLSWHT